MGIRSGFILLRLNLTGSCDQGNGQSGIFIPA